MKIAMLAAGIGVAVAATLVAPAAQAATEYGLVGAKTIKTIVKSDAIAPTNLGSKVSANQVYAIKNAPGTLACLSADGNGNSLPDGALMIGQGWDYVSGGEHYTVGTTVYQYRSADDAKAAVKALRNRECPEAAGMKYDDNGPVYKADQGADIEGRRNGAMGYSYAVYPKQGPDKGLFEFSIIRPVGNAIIESSGWAPKKSEQALESWARSAVNAASDAYAKAAQR